MALPTCGLALAESEREMPRVLELLESSLKDAGLRDAPISIRMTGFSTFQVKDDRTMYTFTLALKGFYVVDVNGAEPKG